MEFQQDLIVQLFVYERWLQSIAKRNSITDPQSQPAIENHVDYK